MNVTKIKPRVKSGENRGTVHQSTMDGSSHVRGMSPTSRGPLSSFYSTGPVLSLNPLVQVKLTIGQPNDRYEQEADRVADQVMRMPEPGGSSVQRQSTCPECPEKEEIQTKPLADQITPLVQRQVEEEEEEEASIHAKQLPGKLSTVTAGLQNQIQSIRGGGQPIPNSVRNYFEPWFGADFGAVRIHLGANSVQMNQRLSAQAFTVGNNIYFNEGQYNMDTSSGKHLLAHELTHTVQQAVPFTAQDRHLIAHKPAHVRQKESGAVQLKRYTETTKPASKLAEYAKFVLMGPLAQTLINIPCLNDLKKPNGDITFGRWIPHACKRSTTNFLHSREWDAFGHCWIACEGTRSCGEFPTGVLGTGHEISRELGFGGPHDSFKQDINNQSLGRSLAFSRGKCFTLCDNAHKSGRLDLSAPIRKCANCATYPGSGSEGPCPSSP